MIAALTPPFPVYPRFRLQYLRPMLMNVRGSKKSRKVLKKAYTQLVSVKAK